MTEADNVDLYPFNILTLSLRSAIKLLVQRFWINSTVISSRFIDTSNGCVMTAPGVVQSLYEKDERDRSKSVAKKKEHLLKASKFSAQASKMRREALWLRSTQTTHRAKLCAEYLETHLCRLRSMEEL